VRMKIRAVLRKLPISNLTAMCSALRAVFIAAQRKDSLLLDLFPEPAAIRNVWENKLAFVEGERAGAVAATEG
jgi:hypothetical protein